MNKPTFILRLPDRSAKRIGDTVVSFLDECGVPLTSFLGEEWIITDIDARRVYVQLSNVHHRRELHPNVFNGEIQTLSK